MPTNDNKFQHLKGEPGLALALASGKSYSKAASDAGVSLATVTRRMADPDYRRHVQQARAEMIEQASGALADATTSAVSTLVGLLEAESEQSRLSAARAILDLAGRYRELVEINERLERVEQFLESNQEIRRIA